MIFGLFRLRYVNDSASIIFPNATGLTQNRTTTQSYLILRDFGFVV